MSNFISNIFYAQINLFENSLKYNFQQARPVMDQKEKDFLGPVTRNRITEYHMVLILC